MKEWDLIDLAFKTQRQVEDQSGIKMSVVSIMEELRTMSDDELEAMKQQL